MNKYAVVMVSTSDNLFQQAVSVINSLFLYGNDVDIHLICHPSIENNHKNILSEMKYYNDIILVPWSDIEDKNRFKYNSDGDKCSGWECRYYRYRYCIRIANNYDAIMITDADMIFVNNIMKWFDLASTDFLLHMPNNPWGINNLTVEKKGIDAIQGASSPPYHNMPLFFNPNTYIDLLKDVYEWGLKEPYGDMATLYRTIFRNGILDKIFIEDNDLWVVTDWYKYMMCLEKDKDGLPIVYTKDNLRVCSIHRRWNVKEVCEKYICDIKEDDNLKRGICNVNIFKYVINYALKNGILSDPIGEVGV